MARSASIRFDSPDQQRLDELSALSISDPSRLARFAVVDALERMRILGKPAAIELLQAYGFREASADRRLVRITVDDRFQVYIDEAIQAVLDLTHAQLTPSKILCVAMIVWMRRGTAELLAEIGAPYPPVHDRGCEQLRSAS